MMKLTKRTLRLDEDVWAAVLSAAAAADRKPSYIVRQILRKALMATEDTQARRLYASDIHEHTSAAVVGQEPTGAHNRGAARRGGSPTSAAVVLHGGSNERPRAAGPGGPGEDPSPSYSSTQKREEEDQSAGAGAQVMGNPGQRVDVVEFERTLIGILNDVGGMGHELDAPSNRYHIEGRLTDETDGKAATAEEIQLVVTYCSDDWKDTKYSSGLTLKTLLGIRFWDYLAMARGKKNRSAARKRERESAIAAKLARKRESEARDEARRDQPAQGEIDYPSTIGRNLKQTIERARLATTRKVDLTGPERGD